MCNSYFKYSLKTCLRYYGASILNKARVKLGDKCADTVVVTLNGIQKSLVRDFLLLDPAVPVILNMGSYT